MRTETISQIIELLASEVISISEKRDEDSQRIWFKIANNLYKTAKEIREMGEIDEV